MSVYIRGTLPVQQLLQVSLVKATLFIKLATAAKTVPSGKPTIFNLNKKNVALIFGEVSMQVLCRTNVRLFRHCERRLGEKKKLRKIQLSIPIMLLLMGLALAPRLRRMEEDSQELMDKSQEKIDGMA